MRAISNSDHAVILRHVPKVASLAMAASGSDLRAYNAARLLLRTWNRLVRMEKKRIMNSKNKPDNGEL